ncbi:MAG: nucleotidyltransferase family protein [Candidatus Gracilibacteria bacterium]|nr:nucleotidyltransferase family protein [Candidatus Gracilibacteria bacterium]
MKAIVLAAGYATRLYPLTLDTPKPLLEVGGRSILDTILEKLAPLSAVEEIFVVTNSKFFSHFQSWEASISVPQKVTIVDDRTTTNETRRGSLGDIRFVLDKFQIDEDFLVVAGDNLFDFPLTDFLSFSQKKEAPAVILSDVGQRVLARMYGVVSLDDQQQITEFIEKPDVPNSSLVSTGIYFFPAAQIADLRIFTDEHHGDRAGDFLAWLQGRTPVFGFPTAGTWYDIGSLEQLEAARDRFCTAEK